VPLSNNADPTPAAFGWCDRCQVEHRLPEGSARQHAVKLMQELAEHTRIDYGADPAAADSRFSTDYLYGEARGQMFGVLACENGKGETVVLRAFSSQYNSVWQCDGWVPPLFDPAAYDQIVIPGDLAIKELGRKIEALDPDCGECTNLRQERKRLSQVTMKKIHRLYELENFRGKLLTHAVRNNLRPVGITEFYWGKTNRSGTRVQGQFYDSCVSKCQPILGFVLCGLTT